MTAGEPPLASAPAPSPAPVATARPPRRWRRWIPSGLAVAALAVSVWIAYDSARQRAHVQARLERAESELAEVRQQSALRLRQIEQRTEQILQDAQVARASREALDEALADLTRGRDDLALYEAERLIAIAALELQIAGQVPIALAALQAADARLARVQRPQAVNLRRAVERDLERLRAAAGTDAPAIALKLDQFARASDDWPLLAEPAPLAAKGEAANAAAAPPAATTAQRVRAWLAAEFGALVRIREVDVPEALLLSAEQQRLVRGEFKLRLLNARQALALRDEKLFRADVNEAQALLGRYFDLERPPVAAAQAQLRQWAQLQPAAPAGLESAAALRGESAR